MSWLRNKLKKTINNILYDEEPTCSPVSVDSGLVDKDPVMTFKIYSANNGRVIEFSKYNPNTDRVNREIYIINPDEDLAGKVAKCVMLESAR